MGITKIGTVSLAILFILGCSPAHDPDPAPPPPKTVFDPLTRQLDRAKAVQGTVDSGAEATRKAVDNQERGDNP